MDFEKHKSENPVIKDDYYNKLKGGPHGLGDPEDQTLRKVEIEVMIPKKMRAIAHAEKCVQEVADFSKCCKAASYKMVFVCREENAAMKQCLEKWYFDEKFKERCKIEYLKERAEFRKTGIPIKKRNNRVEQM